MPQMYRWLFDCEKEPKKRTRPQIFRTQLRALYRASVHGNLAIMFPMITSLEEVRQVKEICRQVRQELQEAGVPFRAETPLGIMIETPAAALISDRLAPEVDFFSIGTNDLTQYTLAVDRQNGSIGAFCNPHHEAVLRLIRYTAEQAHQAGIWVGSCLMPPPYRAPIPAAKITSAVFMLIPSQICLEKRRAA